MLHASNLSPMLGVISGNEKKTSAMPSVTLSALSNSAEFPPNAFVRLLIDTKVTMLLGFRSTPNNITSIVRGLDSVADVFVDTEVEGTEVVLEDGPAGSRDRNCAEADCCRDNSEGTIIVMPTKKVQRTILFVPISLFIVFEECLNILYSVNLPKEKHSGPIKGKVSTLSEIFLVYTNSTFESPHQLHAS